MNILVTGANGQLGNEMRRVSSTSSNQYIFTDVAELDITSRDSIRKMVNDNQIHVIVNCAAYTNPNIITYYNISFVIPCIRYVRFLQSPLFVK